MRDILSGRDKWQDMSALRGSSGEHIFNGVMATHLSSVDNYDFVKKPKTLRHIYKKGHGIVPDFSITNTETNKTIWVELKRQGNSGNAHERACKYFAPAIVQSAKKIGNLLDDEFPFWLIFMDGLANNERYRREIIFWFGETHKKYSLLWKDLHDYEVPIKHFNQHIEPILSKAPRT
jgi:hypothetical protein